MDRENPLRLDLEPLSTDLLEKKSLQPPPVSGRSADQFPTSPSFKPADPPASATPVSTMPFSGEQISESGESDIGNAERHHHHHHHEGHHHHIEGGGGESSEQCPPSAVPITAPAIHFSEGQTSESDAGSLGHHHHHGGHHHHIEGGGRENSEQCPPSVVSIAAPPVEQFDSHGGPGAHPFVDREILQTHYLSMMPKIMSDSENPRRQYNRIRHYSFTQPEETHAHFFFVQHGEDAREDESAAIEEGGRHTVPRGIAPQRRIYVVVFSIDGGGIRGIIPAFLMELIETKVGKPISQIVDLIAGTSTGGILALGLSTLNEEERGSRYSARDLFQLYLHHGPTIFTRRKANLSGLRGAEYKTGPFEDLLNRYFKETTMADSAMNVLVTAFDVERTKPKFFKSYTAAQDPNHNFFRKDVARATSAAPTFFKPKKLHSMPNRFGDHVEICAIDGGMCANNPAMCAFSEALRLYPTATDIILGSFGTGHATVPLLHEKACQMGLVGWAQNITDITIDGPAAIVDYQLNQLQIAFGGRLRYFRFQIEIQKENARMDDVLSKNLTILRHRAEELARTPSLIQFIDLLQMLPSVQERQRMLVDSSSR
jgi:patatin-like phospholipase/acyl hydrolase